MMPVEASIRTRPQNSIIGGATLWVLAGHVSEDQKGVAEFFEYLSSAEQQPAWHQGIGYVPIPNAAYDLSKEPGFHTTDPGTDTAIRQPSLNAPTANSKGLRFGNFVQIRDSINEEPEAVWAGGKDARTALDTAVARGSELLRKFERAD